MCLFPSAWETLVIWFGSLIREIRKSGGGNGWGVSPPLQHSWFFPVPMPAGTPGFEWVRAVSSGEKVFPPKKMGERKGFLLLPNLHKSVKVCHVYEWQKSSSCLNYLFCPCSIAEQKLTVPKIETGKTVNNEVLRIEEAPGVVQEAKVVQQCRPRK